MALTIATLALGPLDNRSYVLQDAALGEVAVVDAGFDPDAIIDRVRALGGPLRWILATHAHYDHVCGVVDVQRALGGVFALHPDDRFLLDMLNEQGAAFGLPPVEVPNVDHDLADGGRIALGDSVLDVIHTPGHSPGHVVFRHGDVLLGGDLLFAGSIGRTDLPGGSFEQLADSVHTRVFPLGDDVRVLPGHGPATTIGRERRDNPFVGEHARLA